MNDFILQKLKIPSIGLLVSGLLSGFVGLLTLISGLVRFSGINGRERLPGDEAERIGYYVGTFGGYGVAVLSFIVAPIVVFGAIRMMKGQSRGLAITAAVLSVLPITSCCFFVSAIFGIWALVVLMQSDVKAYFHNENAQTPFPPPPQNW